MCILFPNTGEETSLRRLHNGRSWNGWRDGSRMGAKEYRIEGADNEYSHNGRAGKD